MTCSSHHGQIACVYHPLLAPSAQLRTSSAAGMQASGGLAWFVQVSDIHLSRYAQQQMPQFGDKEGDWGYFASNVLHHLAPGALVLTGDLVDGKTKLMRGSQDAGE